MMSEPQWVKLVLLSGWHAPNIGLPVGASYVAATYFLPDSDSQTLTDPHSKTYQHGGPTTRQGVQGRELHRLKTVRAEWHGHLLPTVTYFPDTYRWRTSTNVAMLVPNHGRLYTYGRIVRTIDKLTSGELFTAQINDTGGMPFRHSPQFTTPLAAWKDVETT
jgi:hypothetical protein